MKIQKINEYFDNEHSLHHHYKKHVRTDDRREFPSEKFKSVKEYNEAANDLASTPCTASNPDSPDDVLGFVEKGNGARVKWRKSTDEITVYYYRPHNANKYDTRTYYKSAKDKYKRLYLKYYDKDIPEDSQ